MPLPNTSKFISARRCEERIPMGAANPRFLQSVNWQPLVLVVETDEDTRLMMKYLLQMWRCEVIETADAEEALKFTETRQPDVILISGKVRQGDILTTIKRMREMSPPGKTTIVHISAFSEPAVGASALAAGADNFLVKPIDFGHLEKMLHRHLEPETGAGEMFFIN